MPADSARLRYYVDESMLGVGKALAIARTDVVHPGHPLLPEVPLGAKDPDWMPIVASRSLVVIARDRHVRTRPAEVEAFREHGLRVFWLAGKKELTSWGKLVRLVRRWDDIERLIDNRGSGPWFMSVNEGDITEIPVPGTQ